MKLAERVSILKPTAVNGVLAEAKALQANGRTLVSLMRGQPDTPTPLHIVEAAEKALRDGRTGYPDNQGEPILRQAIAEKLWRDNDLTYDANREILVTDGATGGIFTALATLVQPGDDVLVPDPIYDAYASPIAIWGARSVPVPSTIRAGRFVIGREALEAACTPQSRVLLLNSPWNPTGTVFSRTELQTFVDFAIERDLIILSDEIYERLIYDGERHISPASLSSDAKARTVVVNSLSKTYSMTGWRVGYCAGPESIVRPMALVWQQFSRGPATFVQHAAAAALTGDQACVAKMASEFQARREATLRALQFSPSSVEGEGVKTPSPSTGEGRGGGGGADAIAKAHPPPQPSPARGEGAKGTQPSPARGEGAIAGVNALVPQGGLFVMLDVRGLGLPSDEVRRYLLNEAGVVVIHGAAYGTGGEGMLRVSFAAGGDTLSEGLQRLRVGLTELAKKSEAKK